MPSIGLETARRLWGDNYQVLVATHFNTGTYNHFVVNSVGMGRKKLVPNTAFIISSAPCRTVSARNTDCRW